MNLYDQLSAEEKLIHVKNILKDAEFEIRHCTDQLLKIEIQKANNLENEYANTRKEYYEKKLSSTKRDIEKLHVLIAKLEATLPPQESLNCAFIGCK